MAFPFIDRTNRCRNWSGFAICLLLMAVVSSCKKNEPSGDAPVSLQLFNGMDDGVGLVPIFQDAPPVQFRTSRLLTRTSDFNIVSHVFFITNSVQPLRIYAWPDTLSHQPPMLNLNLELLPQSIYSLFVSGSKTNPLYLLHKDNIPALNSSDSTTHFRFVNLTDVQTISVNIKGNAAGSYIQSLAPQKISEFTEFSAKRNVQGYEFEIRDQADGTLLATYNTGKFDLGGGGDYVSSWFNKSSTLVFTGKQGGTGQNLQKVSLMRHR